ncbi:hypothetical protein PBCV1_a597L [Paramecium bursaria Chlorella virus 1]|uniref:Uncharacterized protein n=1 Tax=Paramecium bursaria Chlorella virus 1 TaxID=10506 RepID=O41079_PBCV1|nr:hypothetical protein PBCV1_a597L [Paramecium bursaria Chlorella virus 1]AAC97019.1 hypothetical protein [Paramecium bursaria Chlorella virus 1]
MLPLTLLMLSFTTWQCILVDVNHRYSTSIPHSSNISFEKLKLSSHDESLHGLLVITLRIPDCIINLEHSLHGNSVVMIEQPSNLTPFLAAVAIAFASA